ncbi:MAG: response regulator [Pontiellaceae bacterium]|jgi:CheY-like chemotaxis protein|nr:response regulator [Pontiellaceae bacterium]
MKDVKREELDDYSALEEILPGLTWFFVLDSVPEMVAVLNSDAQCVWVNKGFSDYAGQSRRECIGELFYKLLRLSKLKEFLEIASVRQASEIYTDPSTLKKIQCQVSPVFSGSGSLSGYIVAARDVTDVIQKEEILKVVKERELRARSRNEVFSAKLCCEFRTALTGVIGMAQFLKDTRLDTEQADYVATMDSCSSKMMELIDGLIRDEKEEGQVEQYPEFSGSVSVAQVASAPNRARSVNLTGLKILLAEDNLVNAKVVSKMLEGLGGAVDVAVNGQIACERVASNPYDLVLMDCEMPVMDGYTATRRIRLSGKVRLPVIALTAHATDDAQRLCEEVGMNAYMSKPVRKEQLCQVIQQVLKRQN